MSVVTVIFILTTLIKSKVIMHMFHIKYDLQIIPSNELFCTASHLRKECSS